MHKLTPHKLFLAVQYASGAQCLPTRAHLRRWIKVALQREAIIALRIVDEPEGRELNKNYRGKDYATNVLTFVYDDAKATPNPSTPNPSPALPLSGEGVAPPLVLPLTRGMGGWGGREGFGVKGCALHGDIVICATVVEREAHDQHKGLLAHYAHLSIHAALHLQGYGHEVDTDAAEMETLETALMLKLRFPDPYLAI